MRRVADALAILSVCGLLGFGLFAWSRRVDSEGCERYEQELRALLALDFRLTAEVMKARSGLVGHYDGIVQTEAARKRSHRRLRSLPQGLAGGDLSGLTGRLAEGERARSRTADLVERFKRENAVLRNSLRYLPVLTSELGAAGEAGPLARLLDASTRLVSDELLAQSWHDRSVSERIDRELSALERESRATPLPFDSAEAVLLHARIVRERTPLVYELTREIAGADDAARTQATMAAFLRRKQAALQIADTDASLRFVLALLALSALAASIILRLRHSADQLQKSGDRLSQAVTSLRVEQEKQRELSALKSRFISMASHEFRTPLSVIMSSSEMLEAYGERWTTHKKHEHFARVHEAAQGMTRMLDAILMIGRRDAGLLQFEPRPVEIVSFCAEVVENVGAATGQGRRVIHRGLSGQERVEADPTLLRHALENLLSNALKYSAPELPVELIVSRENGELRFDVCDRGIGISEDDQRHLFETFHRGTNVGEVSGTGLGLAIVQGAVVLHGGSVAVESRLGEGTQFTLRIPCTRSEP